MSAASARKAGPQPKFDLITRGSKKPTPLGTSLFVVMRALDPILQYSILTNTIGPPLLTRLGLGVRSRGPVHASGLSAIDGLGLSPWRLALLGMVTASAAKQIFWLLYTSEEEFPASAAVPVALYNTLMSSLNTLAFVSVRLSPASTGSLETFSQIPAVLGSAMYVVGLVTESAAEVQRKWFKQDPRNKGKCFTGGLWSLARHINYTGYATWRAGFALASAGWPWGAVTGGWAVWDFTQRAIPVLDTYCAEKYGLQWTRFKKQTPYKILPGIW